MSANTRFFIGIGTVGLLVPALAAAQPATGDAARNWSAIAQCGAIDNADRRHACMDDVLREAGILTEARVARNERAEFGRQREAERPARVAPPPQARPAAREEIDQLVTTIRSVSTVGYRQLRVTTTEGSVWDQTQTGTAEFAQEPKPGDGFAIEKASLGSYLCRFGRSKAYRCRRVD